MLPHITTWLNGHVTLCLGRVTIGHQAANFSGFRHCGNWNKTFLICHVISKEHVFKRVVWLYAWKHLIVTHQIAKFNGHELCGTGDIMVFWRKWSFGEKLHATILPGCAFVSLWKELVIVYPQPAKFGRHKHCDSGCIMILVCHVISQEHLNI